MPPEFTILQFIKTKVFVFFITSTFPISISLSFPADTKLISKFNLPTSLKDIKGRKISSKILLDKFYLDKKVKNGKITLILSNGIGSALIKNDINERTLKNFLSELVNE